ncbi:hypothetical protein QJS10_CPB20g01332 [Acorus calamus]|uniref:Uncharacterized protein n=1 Tax=Acorus calamus TaxID=4465 RepID=A0AAV9CCT5_ACOCL|nr:hypothetical protein QJS10_CPB20g01332 [Acorus calamus]
MREEEKTMATSSPMLCNNSNETGSTLPVNNGSLTPQRSILIDTPRQNLRGLNKPKCIKCGNVARSSMHSLDVPVDELQFLYQLRSSDSYVDYVGVHISHARAAVQKLRILATFMVILFQDGFTKFVHVTMAVLGQIFIEVYFISATFQIAIAVNAWRFSKLKEYTEGNLKAETEEFERYMQNVSLLDEVFSPNLFLDGLMRDRLPAAGDSSCNEEDENIKAILTMKARLKSSAERIDSYRGIIKGIVSQGLNRMKVESYDEGDSPYNDDVDDCVDHKRPKKWLWMILSIN